MTNKRDIVIGQIALQEKMQSLGINLVTCGHCGTVLLHKTKEEKIDCFCGRVMSLSDCPDYWYRGMENNEVY
jgi:hypothetical protein